MSCLNSFKEETRELCILKKWDKSDILMVWLLFMEEIGELASAIRHVKNQYVKPNMKKGNGIDVIMEMGDVFSYLFQLVGMLNIDLDDMWVRQMEKAKNKTYPTNNNNAVHRVKHRYQRRYNN